jgi:hypothetical protein
MSAAFHVPSDSPAFLDISHPPIIHHHRRLCSLTGAAYFRFDIHDFQFASTHPEQ